MTNDKHCDMKSSQGHLMKALETRSFAQVHASLYRSANAVKRTTEATLERSLSPQSQPPVSRAQDVIYHINVLNAVATGCY